MAFPVHRYRRLRKSGQIRNLIAETKLSVSDLLVPLFIMEGRDQKDPIASMPGYFRYSADLALKEVEECMKAGLGGFLLFVKVEPGLKDNEGMEAINPDGLMPRSIRSIKQEFPEAVIFSDVALDPYSSFGHDGIVIGQKIVNDLTVEVLCEMAEVHAEAGVDFVAPSDMMDGRVKEIRRSLDAKGFNEVGIMSYAAKYASSFYGPFRDALDSAPGFGDKKEYQMDFRNIREAIKECEADWEEGADILMIKPALPYIDVIRAVRERIHVPVAAYQVSGEYSMIRAASDAGYLNGEDAMVESLTSIKRAGADIIASYFAREMAELIRKG